VSRPLAALLTLAPLAARAWSWEGSAGSLDLGGSIRTIPALVQQPLGDPSLAALDQTFLRLTAVAKVSDFFRLEVHAVESAQIESGSAARGGASFARGAQRYRAIDLRWRQLDEERASAALEIDRLNLRLALPGIDVTVGRQAINFSKTLFWNPLDAFLPFDPRAFDRDYKPGVDALRIQIALAETTGLEVVAAAGPTLKLDAKAGAVSTEARFFDSTETGAALVLRAFATHGPFDFSLQGGKVYGGFAIGAGMAAEVLGFGVRSEATLFAADRSLALLPDGRGGTRQAYLIDHGFSFVFGVDRRFASELTLALELFHNGAAETDDLVLSGARVALGQAQSLSRNLMALSATWQITPVWSLSAAGLLSLSDASALLTPGIKWSAANEVEVLAGALIGIGTKPRADGTGPAIPQSEFGTYPNLFWAEAKLYF